MNFEESTVTCDASHNSCGGCYASNKFKVPFLINSILFVEPFLDICFFLLLSLIGDFPFYTFATFEIENDIFCFVCSWISAGICRDMRNGFDCRQLKLTKTTLMIITAKVYLNACKCVCGNAAP